MTNKKPPRKLKGIKQKKGDVLSNKDEIVFLGTGGARYVIAKQLRATGGMLFRIGGRNVLVDPGPESLHRLLTYLPKFIKSIFNFFLEF